MKNRSLVVIAIVFLMLGMQHMAAATAVVEVPVAGAPGLDNVYDRPMLQGIAAKASHDYEAALANDFQDIRGVGKGLFTAALLNDGLSGDRYEEFQLDDVLGGLDYVSSEELSFAIPNTQYKVVASWGFGGSGKQNLELMLPLPEVAIKLEINEDAQVAPVRRTDGALAGLGKIIIENELNKLAMASEGDLGNILKHFGIAPTLQPRAVFLIKLALLLQHTAKYPDMTFFMNELGFLLCRLVISGDVLVPGIKNAQLTALLPKSVIDLINRQAPNLLPLVEKMFVSTKKLFTGANSDVALAGKKTLAYVFDNNQEAVQKFESYAHNVLDEREVEDLFAAFFANEKMQEIEWAEFHGFQVQKISPMILRSLVGKLVTYGDDVAELVEIGFVTDEEAATLQSGARVRTFSKGSFTIVLCQTDKAFFDISQTVSAIAALVAKSWKSYMTVVRKEVAQGHALDQSELLLDSPYERAELRRFLKSKEGLRLQVRLDVAVQAARNPYDKARLKREQKNDDLAVCEEELAFLQNSLNQNLADRANLVAVNLPDMVTVIADLDKKIAQLEADIATHKDTVKAFNDELDVLDAQIDGNDELIKRDKLDKLLKILKKKYAAGHDVDGDMLQQVKELQRDLEKEGQNVAAVQAQTALSSQDKIDLRDAVLLEYQRELGQVQSDLDVLNDNPAITPALIERIAQLSLYKKFLTARVDRMKKQQKDLIRLVAFKEATDNGVWLDDAQYEVFYNLECELKYILKTNNVVDICRLTKPVESLANRFVSEMTQPAKGSVFMGMHRSFVKDLAGVIARSGIALENEVLVKYLLGMIFPAASQHIVDEIFAQVGAR